jgi:outer membrane biosynthesis protein TonB
MVARAPRKRMYRTMQGRMVDIEKLRVANESVQAVGNMNVNARGDVLGAGGQVVTPKETVIKQYYEQPKGMVSDTPTRGKPMPAPKAEPVQKVQKMTPMAAKPAPKKVAPQPKKVEVKTVETFKPKAESTAKSGIDAALDGLE